MDMHYICLACDQRIERAAFEAHAATHGWNLEQTRQCGYEYDAATRVSTHEFSMRGGPSLFWLVTRHSGQDREMETE